MTWQMEHDPEKLKPATKDKAVSALKKALELSDASGKRNGRLNPERYAETAYAAGHLLAISDTHEAIRLFTEATRVQPGEPKYTKAAAHLMNGVQEYKKQQQEQRVEAERRRLKEMEEEEDAAWEEDGLEF